MVRDDVLLENWRISSDSDTPSDDFNESIFFCGNGRMGVRGYLPYSSQAQPVKNGLFIAGVFDDIKPGITDFVNLPTPIWEQIYIDGEKASVASSVSHILDLSLGLVTTICVLEAGGKKLKALHERIFSMTDKTVLAQRSTFTPFEDMQINVTSGVCLKSCNCPVPDDQVKENNEVINLTLCENTAFAKESFCCKLKTHSTGISITQQVWFVADGFENQGLYETSEAVGISFCTTLKKDTPVSLEKLTAVACSRDGLITQSDTSSTDFEHILAEQKAFWRTKWAMCDVEIEGDSSAQTALRYSIYQLIVNCSGEDDTVSIGARGLTHTRYKGCYFWDTDFFMMPYYLLTEPSAARSLMKFRVNTLPQAKEHAAKMNSLGARYPWMVSYDGSEQCESWDIGASELHITADVVYALNQYITTTGDEDFYKSFAAEVYIETARFWVSRYSKSPDGGYNLLFCKGPDEYCGITSNNLFTNVLVKENLKLAVAAAEYFITENKAAYKRLDISSDEIQQWLDLHDGIKLPHDPDTGRLRTDDTFHMLESADVAALKPDDCASYHRICFDRLQRYKVVKQADVLLLMSRLPQLFSTEQKLAAWEDFEPVCLHDSTLSFASHALFAAQNGIMQKAEYYFSKALYLDLHNIMNNTGKEGLHLACLGETWQTVIFGFAGLRFENGKPQLNPHLPEKWQSLKFSFYYLGKKYEAKLTHEEYKITEM